jgi:hypothetical protein
VVLVPGVFWSVEIGGLQAHQAGKSFDKGQGEVQAKKIAERQGNLGLRPDNRSVIIHIIDG